MKTLIATLLLIPICSVPFGLANADEAPQATAKLRVAAISPTPKLPDLRSPDPKSLPGMDSILLSSVPADSDEAQAAMIVTAAASKDEASNTNVSLAGIGSLYWGAHHPAQAWRLLTPREAGDEFGAYPHTTAMCAVALGTPVGLGACPASNADQHSQL